MSYARILFLVLVVDSNVLIESAIAMNETQSVCSNQLPEPKNVGRASKCGKIIFVIGIEGNDKKCS